MRETRLIIAASESDANLYYATQFRAPDAFIFVWTRDEKILLMSDLEVDRARAHAKVDTVLPIRTYEERAKAAGIERPTVVDAVCAFFAERGIHQVVVPGGFPIEHGDALRARGIEVQVRREPVLGRAAGQDAGRGGVHRQGHAADGSGAGRGHRLPSARPTSWTACFAGRGRS